MNDLFGASAELRGEVAAILCAATWAMASLIFGSLAARIDARALNLAKCAVGGALLLITALLIGHLERMTWHDAGLLVVSGFLGLVVADTCYLVALRELSPARGMLFVAVIPISTALLAVPTLHEPLTLHIGVGMAITVCGLVLVLQRTGGDDVPGRRGLGTLAGVGYAVSQGLANVLTKSAAPALGPLELSTVRICTGAAFLMVWIAARGGRTVVAPLFAAGVRGRIGVATLFGTYVGVLLGTSALRLIPAATATTLVATTPLFALVMQAAITKELPTGRQLAGTCLAFLGVVVLVRG